MIRQTNEDVRLTSCSCFFRAASSFFLFFSSSICEREKQRFTERNKNPKSRKVGKFSKRQQKRNLELLRLSLY